MKRRNQGGEIPGWDSDYGRLQAFARTRRRGETQTTKIRRLNKGEHISSSNKVKTNFN